MERIKELKFQKLSAEEMEEIQGGTFFGKVETAVEGSTCIDSTAGCSQVWERTVYVFGIPIKLNPKRQGCSNSINVARGDVSGCVGCGAC